MDLNALLALFGLSREDAEALVARLKEKFPDAAPVLDEVLAEVANHINATGLAGPVRLAITRLLLAIETGKGPVDPDAGQAF